MYDLLNISIIFTPYPYELDEIWWLDEELEMPLLPEAILPLSLSEASLELDTSEEDGEILSVNGVNVVVAFGGPQN